MTTVNSDKSLEEVISLLRQSYAEYKYLDVEIKVQGKARTNTQNKALHKYFSLLANALNDSGYDMRRTIKPEIDIPWSADLIKRFMWKPLQDAITGEESTAKAKRADYSKVYDVLNRHTAQKLGISVPWPSIGD